MEIGTAPHILLVYYHRDSFTFLWKIPYLIIKIKIFQTFPIKTTFSSKVSVSASNHDSTNWRHEKPSECHLLFKKAGGGNAWNQFKRKKSKFFLIATSIHDLLLTTIPSYDEISSVARLSHSEDSPVIIRYLHEFISQKPFTIGKVTHMNFTYWILRLLSYFHQFTRCSAADPNPTHHRRMLWSI